jgi:rare lipoprotein A
MRNLVMGCALTATVALCPRSEARPPQRKLLQSQIRKLFKSQVGIASWYGKESLGNDTSSGQLYDMNSLTCAHPSLPMGTKVLITNLENSRSVILTVNDRGPGIANRMVDVSRLAAERLGFLGAGLTRVRLQVIGLPKQSAEMAQVPPLVRPQ